MDIAKKYEDERAKRLRPDGISQYVNWEQIPKSGNSRGSNDPWIQESMTHHDNPRIPTSSLRPGSNCKFLIVGAGYGGLLFAVRLLQAGLKLEDIRIVDSAGGFGGTWYWNRYPGLMCDVESYIYMPLLEEMGYMPKHKYSYGQELREYAEAIAAKWDLTKNATFATEVKGLAWDDTKKTWLADLARIQDRDEHKPEEYQVQAQFVFLTSGVTNIAKIPNIPGIDTFGGHSFHTARWDYAYTGGSQQDPSLANLRDKRVGVIGTSATAVQVVPELAKWAKEVYVFQRTPCTVNSRRQGPTDPDHWHREIANSPGWQQRRIQNFHAHISRESPLPSVDMVDDEWTKIPTLFGLMGRPINVQPNEIPTYIQSIRDQDLPHQERIRARVLESVQDKSTAESLKPWYYSWCKRPCFHDDYLPSFNLPHVNLVDTDGKGVDRLSQTGVVVGEREFELDLIVFSTGYRAPADGGPAVRAGIPITGRRETLDAKWERGPATLHGVVTRDFPNLFLTGPNQGPASINWTGVLDQLATHVAYIVAEGLKTTNPAKQTITVEATAEGEEGWSMQVVARAGNLSALFGCTPSFINKESEADNITSPEDQLKGAKSTHWGHGIEDYVRVVEEWRAEGNLTGLEVQTWTVKKPGFGRKIGLEDSKCCLS